MPWKTNGDYFSFKHETIKQHAPAVSGVYGLFNFHHQILIDGADNIRVALLHRLTNTNFRIGRLQPTGFIFEPCAPETRDRRVQELIREYSPLLQPREGVGLTALWRSLRSPGTRAFHPDLCVTSKPASITAARVRGAGSPDKSARLTHFDHKRFDLAAAVCATILLSVGSVAMVPQLKNIFRNYLLDSSFILDDSPSPAGHDNRGDTTPAAFKIALAAGQPGRAIIASTLISPAEAQESAETETIGTEDQETVTAFTSPTPGVTDAAAQIPDRPPVKMPLEVQEKHENTWTVQVLATNDQQIADEWMQKLKAKGYEAFVTDAFVRGKHWQRVRVGRLSTLREAEALRSELASTEGLRETFVARNERSEHLLTLNRR